MPLLELYYPTFTLYIALFNVKASKQTLLELNKQHEIVKLISTSLNKAHRQAVESAKQFGLILKVRFLDTQYLYKLFTFVR